MTVYRIATVEIVEKVYYIGASDQDIALKAFQQYDGRLFPSHEEQLDSDMKHTFYESIELENELDANYTVGSDLHLT